MKKLLIIVCFLPLAAGAQERYRTLRLEPVSEADTLNIGWIDTRAPGQDRAFALVNTYAELITKRAQYRVAQAEIGMAEDDGMSRELNELDAMWEGMRKTYTQMLQQQGLGAEERKEIEQALADIDKNKAETRRQVQGQLEANANAGRESISGLDPAEFSDERLLQIKQNLLKYVLGGRLWGFSSVRDFRNGFAAVARKDRNGDEHWGFVNRAGKLAIPCRWDEVFNFNNHRYYSTSIWDAPEDEDDRPWTTVRQGNSIGMIDSTGVVRIPVRFARTYRPQIVFVGTDKGEFAAAQDPKTRKWGLLDREGNWYMQPFSSGELEWDPDRRCFVDADGQEIGFSANLSEK